MNRLIQWLIFLIRQEYKYFLLFISVLTYIIFNPLIYELGIGGLLSDFILSLMIISGINLASSKRELYFSLIIGVITLALKWNSTIYLPLKTSPIALGQYFSLLFFLSYLTIRLIRQVIRSSKVTSNTIYGALTGYLLIGIIGASLASVIETIFPGSFSVSGLSEDYTQVQLFNYYSFVTLSTLGYGDIVPLTPLAQSLSVTISLIGQMYLTVLVAVLVGKYSSKS